MIHIQNKTTTFWKKQTILETQIKTQERTDKKIT